MKITLITDSTCDIAPGELSAKGIKFAPLKVLFPDGEYVDKIDLTNPEFYGKMKTSETLPSTSQVNPNEFHELFEEELKAGNHVIGLFLSSDLSGTYQSAVIAKEMTSSENITLIDARTTSFGLGLLLNTLIGFVDQGLSVEEIVEAMNEKINKTQLYGMLDTLENLKKGGRLSSSSAMIGKMLNLKPIIETKDGLVGMAAKVRGSKKGMNWMLEKLLEEYPEGKVDVIGIAHANNLEKMEEFRQLILKSIKVDTIYESEIGSVVGTHTGEGAVGLVYFKK
jgi:DegV family protein with EDD domain